MKKQSEQEKFYGTLNGVARIIKFFFIFALFGLSILIGIFAA